MSENRCIVKKGIEDLSCQFQESDKFTCKVFAHEGDSYCIFHLPLESKKEILKKNNVADDELKYLKEGKAPDRSIWKNYNYVVDDENYNIGFLGNVEKLVLSFIGIDLNRKDLILNAGQAQVNEVKIHDITNIRSIEIAGESIGDIIINNSNVDFINLRSGRYLNLNIAHCRFDTLNLAEKSKISISSLFFQDCKFEKINIKHLYVESSAVIKSINILKDISIEESNFSKGASFLNCEFGGKESEKLQFDCAFDHVFNISNSVFGAKVYFNFRNNSNSIDKKIKFENVSFDFHLKLTIQNSTAINSVELISSSEAYMDSCSFSLSASQCKLFLLKNYIVKGAADFKSLSEDKFPPIDCSGTYFKGGVNFNSLIFTGRTNFEDCKFDKAPLFYKTALHPDTIFPSKRSFKENSRNAINAYHALYTEAVKLKMREYEGMFYALTQKCNRKYNLSWFKPSQFLDKFFSLLYDKLSEYGRNYWRPFFILLFLVLGLFPTIYMYTPPRKTYPESIAISLKQVLPYGFLRHDDKKILSYYSSCKKEYLINDIEYRTEIPLTSNKPHLMFVSRSSDREYCVDHYGWFFYELIIESISVSIIFFIFILALRWNFKKE